MVKLNPAESSSLSTIPEPPPEELVMPELEPKEEQALSTDEPMRKDGEDGEAGSDRSLRTSNLLGSLSSPP
ncbi:hypothetical protein RHGRI_004217 [Rhododendron griersonianum]|uniref:Uncharacterized protein n=1 Tax=Rhododendron griersonianum TaxID=479676 RepID=A0AAV6L7V3_9ERIC|nr:hypothetical protein RHGRI_004217 [Rhododendron griersonianum]